jgi:hypothetical protein
LLIGRIGAKKRQGMRVGECLGRASPHWYGPPIRGNGTVGMRDRDPGEISIWLGKTDDRDYQYGELAWSPDAHDIIVGMRLPPDFTSRGLWLAQVDMLGGPMIARDPNYIYQSPKWDLSGSQLLFQQEEIKGEHTESVLLWKSGTEQGQVIAQGYSPHWLP